MKHVFIVNPEAGWKSALPQVEELLKPLQNEGLDCEMYVTRAAGDARRFAKERAQQHLGPMRFYACGGDGTLHEVVNGALGYAHVAVGA